MTDEVPNARQVMGARVRAAVELWKEKFGKRTSYGYEYPPRRHRDEWVSQFCACDARDVTYYLTFTRRCTHPWSDGACVDCPDVGPWPEEDQLATPNEPWVEQDEE